MDLYYYSSPMGTLQLKLDHNYLYALELYIKQDPSITYRHPLAKECFRQLDAYFNCDLKSFDLPIKLEGTPFQVKVWEQLLRIPYGTTSTYGDIARKIGRPKACRAVGGANNKNKLMIIVPCHRVIGSGGKLIGYGGGLDNKEYLLKLENVPTSVKA
ncbi:MAG: methylated-DNA--[protein]-cysteine S-methyltransferase [Eubacteriales bacterium]